VNGALVAALLLAALLVQPQPVAGAPVAQETPLPASPGNALPEGPAIDGLLPDAAPDLVPYPLGAAGLPLEGPLVINGATAGAHSVRTADFDGDGDLDVLSAARDSGQVIWYRNSGGPAPSFEPRPLPPVPGVYLAFPADMNGDGKIDIVVAAVNDVNPSSVVAGAETGAEAGQNADADAAAPLGTGSLLWFQNNGQPAPAFTARTIAGALNYPVSAAARDLDGDGDMDLVAASRDDNSIIWYASSGGPLPTFAPRLITNAAAGAVSVDVGDVDRDGDADVVSASEDDDRILLHLNDGRGNFATTVVRPGTPQPEVDFAKSVRLADLDGDGALDIAYASEDQNLVGWYANNGARPPQWAPQPVTANNGVHVKFVTSADMDNDGDEDLISAWSGLGGQDTAVLWHRNGGQAAPTFATFTVTTLAVGARYVEAADLDGDGDMDLLTASRDDGRILWFRNHAPHRTTILSPAELRPIGTYTAARHIIAADVDGDGDNDFVTVGESSLVWHESNGAQPPAFAARPIPSSISGGRWVDAADLDGDGDMDLSLASTNNGAVFWYENNGARPPVFTERLAINGLGGPRSVVSGDLDGDGDMDLAIPSDEDHRLVWLENNGARPAGFTLRLLDQQPSASGYFRTIFPADMDRDGDLDLVSASSNGDQILLYTNQGGRPATFSRREISEPGSRADYPQHLHVDDVDGDGDPDILVASERDNSLSWYENLDGRAGAFARRMVDGGAAKIHAVVGGDIDHDGDLDLFAAIEGANAFAWYENNGARPPGFTKRVIYEQAFVAHGVNVADVDGDGDLDLMGAARDNGLMAWFENEGGQFRLSEVGFGQKSAAGKSFAVTTLRAQHAGRAGDAPVQIAALDMRFVDGSGRALSTSELVARARSVSVYADTLSNGQFDYGADRLLINEARLGLATGGRLVLSVRNTPPGVDIAPGGTVLLFAVVELSGVCSSDGTVRPVVRPTAQTGVDAWSAAPLVAEYMVAGGGAVVENDPPRQLRINEISAYAMIGDIEIDDWIEIYNPGPLPVEMGGMYITDDTSEPKKYRLPSPLLLPVGGFLILVADDDGDMLHPNFKLSRSGETVGLFDTDARSNRPLDVITFGEQPVNSTSGRWPDGGANWRQLPAPSKAGYNVSAGLSPWIFLPVAGKGGGC
jgi:hypothetical protein